MTPFELLLVCAPLVAPVTMAAVVQQESGGNPFTIHDNATGASYRPRTEPQAIALARDLVAAGHPVDLGMGQVNSANLPGLGLTVRRSLALNQRPSPGERRSGKERNG